MGGDEDVWAEDGVVAVVALGSFAVDEMVVKGAFGRFDCLGVEEACWWVCHLSNLSNW